MTYEERVQTEHMIEANDIPRIVKRARWIQETVNTGYDGNKEMTYFGEKPITREEALMIALYCCGIKGDDTYNYSTDPDNFERREVTT